MSVFRSGERAPEWCELEHFAVIDLKRGERVTHKRRTRAERVMVTRCRKDSDQPGLPPTKPEQDYCQVSYPDRPKRGGFEASGVELRGYLIKCVPGIQPDAGEEIPSPLLCGRTDPHMLGPTEQACLDCLAVSLALTC